ncbi:MAG: hypothetical protein ATN31_08870 [Candidatus Epulonipiscioides saccharophilum]|nr:MAG: hypothetical protein ATN31_08870 [Epulopiscium sp. AS2M-Bin001]
MIFASMTFLFVFFPIVLIGYFILPTKLKNVFLFIASLYFYAWGEPTYIYLMIFSICFNYIIGLCVENRKDILFFGVFINLWILFIFKYESFIIENINEIFNINLPSLNLLLPIGISFFTFQAITYLVDIYRKEAKAQINPINLGLYISLFPQLIAGPIVRYTDISKQIDNREITLDSLDYGCRRFIVGLGKKVILANNLAIISQVAIQSQELSVSLAWLGMIAYVLQLYYDFSGYSDMAIGLGKMFGFSFAENFNYPYISKTVSEFWRRWHISLATFFRDYVYFPMGGSKVSTPRLYLNLFVVWSLTGLWHGGAWQFFAWGMLNFILLLIERKIRPYLTNKYFAVFYQIYTMFFIFLGMMIFAETSLSDGIDYILTLLGRGELVSLNFYRYLNNYYLLIFFSIIFATPIIPKLKTILSKYEWLKNFIFFVSPIVYILIFMVSVSYLTIGAHNPFIYFNF